MEGQQEIQYDGIARSNEGIRYIYLDINDSVIPELSSTDSVWTLTVQEMQVLTAHISVAQERFLELCIFSAIAIRLPSTRREFLKMGSIISAGLLLTSCAQPAASEATPTQENSFAEEWARYDDNQKLSSVESGVLLDPVLKQEIPGYEGYLAEYIEISLRRIFPRVSIPEINYVNRETFVQQYKLARIDGETFSDTEILEEINRKRIGAFVSRIDDQIYVWNGEDSPVSSIFKAFRTDTERNPQGLDTFAIGMRITLSHEITQSRGKVLTGEEIPEELEFVNTPWGLMVVDEIDGFCIRGILLEGGNRVSYTSFDEAASELINSYRTQKAGLFYTNVTAYTNGVVVLEEVLNRTGIEMQEFIRIREDHGYPGLEKAWSQQRNLSPEQISSLFSLVTGATSGEKSVEEAFGELDSILGN